MSENAFGLDDKYLEIIRWPFKKYLILLPEKNNVDAFEWLFVSFVKLYNRRNGNKEFCYNEKIENIVKGQIRQYFTNLIDVPTLNKVICEFKTKYLDPKNHNSIKVFNNLFKENLQIRYIFQDCITGSVVPYFYNGLQVELELPPEADFEGRLNPIRKSEPAKKFVKLAFVRYLNRNRYAEQDLDGLVDKFEQEEVDLSDENTQLFEDDDPIKKTEDFLDPLEVNSNPNKFDIKFLDKGTIVYFNVSVYVEFNKLVVKSPFDISTKAWMNMCFDKGSKEDAELKDIYDRLSKFLVSEQKVEHFYECDTDSIYEKLPNCANLYKIVDSIGDNSLRVLVWQLEEFYVRRNPYFFINCTVILERLLKLIIDSKEYTPSDIYFRECADQKVIIKLLNIKCPHIDCHLLTKWELINKWKNKYGNPQNKSSYGLKIDTNWVSFDFKSDFLDLMIQSDISKSPFMKYDSVNHIWSLWDARNKQSHYNDHPKEVTSEYLEYMLECVNLLSQKIKRGVQ